MLRLLLLLLRSTASRRLLLWRGEHVSFSPLLLLALGCALLGSSQSYVRAASTLAVSYAGVDYVDPGAGLTGCAEFTWLQAGCYTNSTLTSAHLSPQSLLQSDISFMTAQHLGQFQRVWISLDELMYWNSSTGYAGYVPQALANVDDMLARFAAAGIKVDLVLYAWMGGGYANLFQPQALDGDHPTMRANYLNALHDFIAHLASNSTDAATVSVMDLQAEGYYQLEQYFSSAGTLGIWAYTEPAWPQSNTCYVLSNTLCTGGSAGHGCLASSGAVDNACLDVNLIEPWFAAEYATAKAAGPAFNYTISDTGRLLTTDTSTYNSQAWWESLYPVDVYDIHLYSDNPSASAVRWATGLTLPKPWFAGEVGCATSNTNCTYSGSAALPVDQWWLSNLAADGAHAVLVEDRRTAWGYTYTNSGEVATLTPVGQAIASADSGSRIQPSTSIFSENFDQQGIGALQLQNTSTEFTGVSSSAKVSVENFLVVSASNALIVSLAGGGSADAYKQYATSYTPHHLRFKVLLSNDFVVPSGSYLILARTQPTASSTLGKVDLTMNAGNGLYLSCTTATGTTQYVWTTGVALSRGIWHTVDLAETVGSSGSLSLLVDGRQIGQTSGINLGSQGVGYVALGEVSTPTSPAPTGNMYFDDVQTSQQ